MDASNEARPAHPFKLTTESTSFIGLVLVNVLLNFLTLTLYRFWGRTAIRRRLWAETEFAGDTFEYVGKGSELFVGFLIATVGVFLPVVAVIFAAQAFLEPALQAVVIICVYIVIGVLGLAAIFLVRRYQLSRTVWRGLRFGLNGSPWDFALLALGQYLLAGVTLGWWGPHARQKIAQHIWNQTRYGDEYFTFAAPEGEGLAKGTYGPFALGWGVGLIAYIALGIFAAIFGPREMAAHPTGDSLALMLAPLVVLLVAAPIVILSFALYEAAAMRRTASLLRFGDTHFKLNVKTLDLIWLNISNFLVTVLSLGILFPLTQIRSWRFVIRRLEAIGTLSLATVAQSKDRGPRSGEGLADGFDFGGV